MKVVVNATPLVALAVLEKLNLMQRMFGDILVPPAVYQEVTAQGAGRAGASATAQADWLQIVAPTTASTIEPLLLDLDKGKSQ